MGSGCHLKKDTTPTRNTGVKVKHHQKTLNLTKLSPWVILKIHWMPECQWPLESTNQHWPGLVCQLVYGFVAVGCRLAPATVSRLLAAGFLENFRIHKDFFSFIHWKVKIERGRTTETRKHSYYLRCPPKKELFQLGIHRLQPLIFRGKIRSFSGVNNFKPWPIGPFSMGRQAHVFAGCCCRSNGLVHPTFFLARPWKQLAPWNLIALKRCLNHSYFFVGGNFKEVFAWWTKSSKPVDMVTWLRPKYVT